MCGYQSCIPLPLLLGSVYAQFPVIQWANSLDPFYKILWLPTECSGVWLGCLSTAEGHTFKPCFGLVPKAAIWDSAVNGHSVFPGGEPKVARCDAGYIRPLYAISYRNWYGLITTPL